MKHSAHADRPLPPPARHLRLFELIRQAGLARQVCQRLAQQQPPDASQLRRLTAGAQRSLRADISPPP